MCLIAVCVCVCQGVCCDLCVFETGSCSVAQAGVQLCGQSSLCLELLDSRNPPASAYQVAGTTGVRHLAWLVSKVFVEMGSCYAAQAGLELLASSDTPALVSHGAGIAGMGHRARPDVRVLSLNVGMESYWERVFADVIKDLAMRRLSCITQVALSPSILIRGRQR
uniref:Uncharacterized protein n=1 Tax=Macaca fascicularis TaxID=9541 RepID=A0A7N9CBH7_MACFA